MSLDLVDLLERSRIVVCCGTGGVGKTTTAAALGLEAARRGRRVVVVTIDPARRLADALGATGGLGNDPVRIELTAPGEMWALMLDTATTFDGLVRAHATDVGQAERILDNTFYRNIAGSLSGTQEYMAAERLHALHLDPRFDLVIVDTPPTRHALDFLDAPGTLSRFLDHPLFRMLMLPTRRGLQVLNIASQPVLRTIGKVVGGDVLADAVAFFQAFAGMETGFRERADEVLALLHGSSARFVLVASPRADTLDEADYFADRLAAVGIDVAAVVLNRCTPDFGPTDSRRADAPRAADAAPGETAVDDTALAALYDNLDELRATARLEQDAAAELLGRARSAVHVPMLAGDVHDMDTLELVRTALTAGTEP